MTLSVLQDLPALVPVISPDANSSSFRSVEVLEHVSLLPCYVGRLSEGIIKNLNQKVFRFSSQLGGIVLSYSKPMVLQRHGAILDEQPHVHFDLKYTAYLFKPQIGSIMCGVVNNVGRNHIGCLVNNCFNASVLAPTSQVHTNGWFSETFEICSTVWFQVSTLENIGGVVSIGGEYCDINHTDDLPEIDTLMLGDKADVACDNSAPVEERLHTQNTKHLPSVDEAPSLAQSSPVEKKKTKKNRDEKVTVKQDLEVNCRKSKKRKRNEESDSDFQPSDVKKAKRHKTKDIAVIKKHKKRKA